MKIYLPTLLLFTLISCGPSKKTDGMETNESDQVDQAAAKVEQVNTEQLKQLIRDKKNLQIVDVRTTDEVSNGYIDNAMVGMNYLTGEFEKKIHTLDKNKPVVVYCASGGRSGKSAELLLDKGFKEVYNYKDGYSNWSDQ